MLKISNLSVSVENKLIIDNLNLEIPKGKKVAIMGPNGSVSQHFQILSLASLATILMKVIFNLREGIF